MNVQGSPRLFSLWWCLAHEPIPRINRLPRAKLLQLCAEEGPVQSTTTQTLAILVKEPVLTTIWFLVKGTYQRTNRARISKPSFSSFMPAMLDGITHTEQRRVATVMRISGRSHNAASHRQVVVSGCLRRETVVQPDQVVQHHSCLFCALQRDTWEQPARPWLPSCAARSSCFTAKQT